MDLLENSSNASSSARGWQFQVNAGIFLMLENIENAIRLKIEGASEDIEIRLDDESIILAQAKSFDDPEDSRVSAKLRKGLKTLKAASNKHKNSKKLIYISNAIRPICSKGNAHRFYDHSYIKYKDLYKNEKAVVDKYINEHGYEQEEIDKIYFYGLPYHGEESPTRHKEMYLAIRQFTDGIQGLAVKHQRILEKLQFICNYNSTEKSANISKTDFVWPLIVLTLEFGTMDSENLVKEDCDTASILRIEAAYNDLITTMSEKFSFSTKVISDYITRYNRKFSSSDQKDFIENCWMNYSQHLSVEGIVADEYEYEMLIKLIIQRILHARNVISSIKTKSNLI